MRERDREIIAENEVVEIVPVTEGTEVVSRTGPALMDLARMKKLAETAEERVRAMETIVRASLAASGSRDWVDIGGRPYPLEVGLERMARLWAVHIQIVEGPTREDRGDHYLYRTKVRAWSDLLGRSTEVVGMRSSKDPFFAVRYIRTPDGNVEKRMLRMEEVSERDVAAASQTNAKMRAVGELLGIRGLTWADLARYGITPEDVPRVTFEKSKAEEPAGSQPPAEAESAGELTEEQMRAQIRAWLMDLEGGDLDRARRKLIELTTFQGKDGGVVPGVNSTSDLSGRRLFITFKKVQRIVQEAHRKETARAQEVEQ